MTVSAATLRAMMAAGLKGERLLAVVDAMEADIAAALPKRTKGAERQARLRERRALQSDVTNNATDNVTPERHASDAAPTSLSPTPPNPSSPPKETPLRGAKKGELPEAFGRFKAAYPKRLGNNPWEPARQKFEVAVKAGADVQEIIDGAKRYAAEQASIGKVGTEFVMQAKAWLNQKCWQDYPAPYHVGDLTEMVPKNDPRWPFLKARWDRERQPFNDAYVDKWPFPASWLKDANGAATPAGDEWMETDLPAGMDRRNQVQGAAA